MSAAAAPVGQAVPPLELERLAAVFPARVLALAGGGQIAVRESGTGDGVPLVCLHGIGSGSASWLGVAQHLGGQVRLIAWDAPGYGDSSALAEPAPRAVAYAGRLLRLLDALQVERCVLVGHSLGALVAAAAARPASALAARVARLLLISPARGYGAPARAEQAARVRSERLRNLQQLGVAGMAAQRSARLLSEHADAVAQAWVRWNMARLNEGGYRQAVELLCGDDLLAYLPPAMPVRVLCGALDAVTPPAACGEVASACGVALELVARAGHASYVEQPGVVADILRAELAAVAAADAPGVKP